MTPPAPLLPPDGRRHRPLKFQALADELRRGILAGTWPLGSRLPTEEQLAGRTGMSLTTVRRAMDELVGAGLVVRRQGAGSFVIASSEPGPLRDRRVGVLIPDTHFYYPQALQGIEDTLSSARVGLELATYDYDTAREDAAIAALIDAGVDGLILTPTLLPPVDGPTRVAELSALPLPIVLLERSLDLLGPGDRTEHVCSDHAGGAYDAVRHLHRLGHSRIALLVREESPTGAAVSTGYDRAVTDLGLEPLRTGATMTRWRATAARTMLTWLLEVGCTAALVFGDQEALLLQRAALARGLRVPDDLALVSYDDELADRAPVPLTAVSPAKHRLGALATQVMLRRLAEGDACPLHQIRLRPRLVVRDSCGAGRFSGPA
jgi:DNA-binding LacI/PurR family transcriptional regulator